MAGNFLHLALTPSVCAAQARYYGSSARSGSNATPDILGPEEIEFIEGRDSFYIATVGENDWPYIQHRGGAPGFLRHIGANAIAFADYKGNRQLLTTGNLAASARTALFLMDYKRRIRLKVLGFGRAVDAREDPDFLSRITAPEIRAKVERLFIIEVVAFDWNCPQYINPRYTADDVEEAIAPLKVRIAELEAQIGGKKSVINR
jgi:predicted pyridoxine 5'-phosphate oxidase superfamily flavin-nucleotide-binding protein